MPLARIRVSPYSLPSHSSIHPTISSKFHRLHPRRLAILLLFALITLYYLSFHPSTLYIRIPAELVSNSFQLSSLLSPHNDSHSLLRTSTPPLHSSDDPSFTFHPRSPCNALTLSLSLSNSSSQIESWLSPTPPLPPNSTLSNRIASFLSAPLGSVETHKKWNRQVCSNENPSIKYNTNQLHSRENGDWWDTLSEEELRGKRAELVSVLERARKEDRVDEFGGEIRKDEDDAGGRGMVWTAGNAVSYHSLCSLSLTHGFFIEIVELIPNDSFFLLLARIGHIRSSASIPSITSRTLLLFPPRRNLSFPFRITDSYPTHSIHFLERLSHFPPPHEIPSLKIIPHKRFILDL